MYPWGGDKGFTTWQPESIRTNLEGLCAVGERRAIEAISKKEKEEREVVTVAPVMIFYLLGLKKDVLSHRTELLEYMKGVGVTPDSSIRKMFGDYPNTFDQMFDSVEKNTRQQIEGKLKSVFSILGRRFSPSEAQDVRRILKGLARRLSEIQDIKLLGVNLRRDRTREILVGKIENWCGS